MTTHDRLVARAEHCIEAARDALHFGRWDSARAWADKAVMAIAELKELSNAQAE